MYFGIETIDLSYKQDIYNILSNANRQIIHSDSKEIYGTNVIQIKNINEKLNFDGIKDCEFWEPAHYTSWDKRNEFKIYLATSNPLVDVFYVFEQEIQINTVSYNSKEDYAILKKNNILYICLNKKNYSYDILIHDFLKRGNLVPENDLENLTKSLNTDFLIGGVIAERIKLIARKGDLSNPTENLLKRIEAAFQISIEEDNDEEEILPIKSKGIGSSRRQIGIKGEKVIYNRLRKEFQENEINWYNRSEAEPQNAKSETHSKEHCDLIVVKNSTKIYIESKATLAPFNNKPTIIITQPEWKFFKQKYRAKEPYILIRVTNLKTDKIDEEDEIANSKVYIIPNLIEGLLDGSLLPYNSYGPTTNGWIYLTFNLEKINEFETDICKVVNKLLSQNI